MRQPLTEFLEAMNTLEVGKVSEQMGEDRSGDMGGGGGGAMQASGQQTSGTSARDLAIANLPAPEKMQKELAVYIRKEVKKLRKQANSVAKLNRAGAPFQTNELYARMRRLNALFSDLMEASYEVLKRLFIRVFIDKQAIL
jgi:hypothetical protein